VKKKQIINITNSSIVDVIIVLFQFLIIILHFTNFNFTRKLLEINNINFIFSIANLIIIIGFLLIIISVKELGTNISPLPRPKKNSKLIKTGIYSFVRHPMYYALIIISICFFLKTLSLYSLILTQILGLIILLKIRLEEKYLDKKFKEYKIYKSNLKL